MIGFIIWTIAGCCFIGLGIYSFFAKKATGFWANARMFEVSKVRKYNCAMGKLWCSFGFIFILLGIPLLAGQNSSLILLISLPGVFIEVITVMVLYTQVIERKYRKG